MMKKYIGIVILAMLVASGCKFEESQQAKEAEKVDMQQSQYAKGQPIPAFNWSLERHLMIELYNLRNKKVSTHAVWRSDYGMIEGDCPSLGYGLPYDTSLTNPLVQSRKYFSGIGSSVDVVEQPEPNGIFASKNTAATWVMCLGESGGVEPVYVESKVTIYPGPVVVDYEDNRVRRSGAATVMISKQ